MSIQQIIFRISLIILLVEILIMLLINLFNIQTSPLAEALIDASFLVFLSTPLIYIWVVKPFVIMRDKAMEKAAYLAYYDALTGLPNREKFLQWLEHAINRASENKKLIGLILLDLDRFKVINDTFGHLLSDHIILEITQKLKYGLSNSDTLARIGPDQFVLLQEDADTNDDIYLFAKELLASIQTPIHYEGHELSINGSIGISTYPKDSIKKNELLKYAHTAMRQAKLLEDTKISFYTLSLTEAVQKHFTLEEDLRHALENREFFLVYQPKIDATTQQLIGVEALIRWQHPSKGLISPLDFIPLAEQIGLIVPIGEWVLHEALSQLKLWLDEGKRPLSMSINLSGRQLHETQVERIIQTLKASDIPLQYIEFEITETYLMKNAEQSQQLLERLHSIGISLSMDDFGTGYSSLGYLKRFKVDILKIDQMLIRDIEIDKNDFAITKAIVAMAHTLDLKVIAEGVETQTQAKMLQEIGCDYLQGYYYCKPVPGKEIHTGDRYTF